MQELATLRLRNGKIQQAADAAEAKVLEQADKVRKLEICVSMCEGQGAAEKIAQQQGTIQKLRQHQHQQVSTSTTAAATCMARVRSLYTIHRRAAYLCFCCEAVAGMTGLQGCDSCLSRFAGWRLFVCCAHFAHCAKAKSVVTQGQQVLKLWQQVSGSQLQDDSCWTADAMIDKAPGLLANIQTKLTQSGTGGPIIPRDDSAATAPQQAHVELEQLRQERIVLLDHIMELQAHQADTQTHAQDKSQCVVGKRLHGGTEAAAQDDAHACASHGDNVQSNGGHEGPKRRMAAGRKHNKVCAATFHCSLQQSLDWKLCMCHQHHSIEDSTCSESAF
jgi:hypothetical protein